MGDPLSVIGAVASVATIIELVTKSIETVRGVRGRWKEADLAFVSLASQLTALRAALNKIQEWVDIEMTQDPDYQLLLDLDLSMSCCAVLVEKFDTCLSGLNWGSRASLDFSRKSKFLFAIKDLEEVQKMVERQVSALTLLLMAFNCKSTSEQRVLLRSPKARRIIERIETDSASLVVHRDSVSVPSTGTDKLSKFSIRFDFDKDLFVTKVYEKFLRNSIRDAFQRKNSFVHRSDDELSLCKNVAMNRQNRIAGKKRSNMIDRALQKDELNLSTSITSLVLGDSDSGMEQILNQMKLSNQKDFNLADRMMYRQIIHETLIECIKSLVEALKQENALPMLKADHSHYFCLLDYIINRDPDEPLHSNISDAIDALWRDPYVQEILNYRSHVPSNNSIFYFFTHIHRITAPAYVPSDNDILQARMKPNGFYSTRLYHDSLTFQLVAADPQAAHSIKWLHQFEDVPSIIFIVDLSCYDQAALESQAPNRMKERMILFKHVINLKWFKHTSLIILFTNIGIFKRKLSTSPLGDQFNDFSGGHNFQEATDFLKQSFLQLNCIKNRGIYCHFTDMGDESVLQWVIGDLKDVVVNSKIRSSVLQEVTDPQFRGGPCHIKIGGPG